MPLETRDGMTRRLSRASFAGALGALTGTAGPIISRAAGSDAFTMRMSMQETGTSLQVRVALRFAAAVNRRSNGQLKVEIYPNNQLANQQGTVDGLTSGVVDLAIIQASVMFSLVPRFQIFDLPFLFKNLESGFRVLDGPIGNELFADMDSKGITGLVWGSTGFKELETVSKAVVVPEDMKGLRIRVQNGPVYVATYQALGAVPVTIDVSEAFVALSQRTVDGMDINLDAVTTQKFYTVIKHVAMLNHIFVVSPLMGSKRKIEALPPSLQRILREEAKAVVPFWRSSIASQTAEDIQILKQNGVAFTEIQYPAFRKAVDPVYAMVQSKLGVDLIERVGRAAGA
jgi:TRAP-type transport system periplasmic protein